MRTTALPATALVAAILAASAVSGLAEAQSLRRPADAAATPAPAGPPGDPRQGAAGGGLLTTWAGTEAPAYGYGYAFVLPSDGRWRWIDARCYAAGSGERVCVEGHWIRRIPGQCEEVSRHQVRRGNYIRVVPDGRVASCR